MILFDKRTKIKWEWNNFIMTKMKEIQSSTSKVNIEKWTEKKNQFKRKIKKPKSSQHAKFAA